MQTTSAFAILFDTETTDTGDAPDIIEAAWRDVDIDRDEGDSLAPGRMVVSHLGSVVCERFKPSKPILFGAMSTHHIMPEDLEGREPSSSFRLPEGLAYLIGHNIDFDWRCAGSPKNVRRICTLAISRKLWPDLDSHKQGALLYFLLGSNARELVKGAHSAGHDVIGLSYLFQRILDAVQPGSMDALWRYSEEARVPVFMPFGKHRPAPGEKGTPIADLPRDYLEWLTRQPTMDEYVVKAARKALAR